MTDERKVRYLKIDRGRYYYQRRVPLALQDALGIRAWLIPCGDVSYPKAVQTVVTLAEEHDRLISDLKSPGRLRAFRTKRRREEEASETELSQWYIDQHPGATPLVMVEDEAGDIAVPADKIPTPWVHAKKDLDALELTRQRVPPPMHEVLQLRARINRAVAAGESLGPIRIEAHPEYVELIEEYRGTLVASEITLLPHVPRGLDDDEYHDRLTDILDLYFQSGTPPPSNPDDRDEYEFVKRRLERKIAEVSPASDTLSLVAERYYRFNSIKPVTERKYRRHIGVLIGRVGDVPIKQVTPRDLRELRDDLLTHMVPASVHAAFTPIKGLFGYALDNEIIEINPVHGVKLPKDRRVIEERKWLPFDPTEFTSIMEAVDTVWRLDVRGLSNERREAIQMLVRVLAYSAMRPSEVLRLRPEDVTDRSISIHGGKAEGSSRVVPLHPKIAEFPNWVAAGGLSTFGHIERDPVGPVRHNFLRLIREKMPAPICHPRKSLYSLRSTFSNAMRRAGADDKVRRAILGHVEAGALRHYDDGPEFELKRKWVEQTDPSAPYQPD